jgi:hypothetical protein
MSQAGSEQETHPTSQHGGVLPKPQAHVHKRGESQDNLLIDVSEKKGNKSIKEWFYAIGRKQQVDWTKKDSRTPNVATKSVFLTERWLKHMRVGTLHVSTYRGPSYMPTVTRTSPWY